MFLEESVSALRASRHREAVLRFSLEVDESEINDFVLGTKNPQIFSEWELRSEYCLTLLSARTLIFQGGKQKFTACVSPATVIYRLALVRSCEVMGALAARLRLTFCLPSGALQFVWVSFCINSTSSGLKPGNWCSTG